MTEIKNISFSYGDKVIFNDFSLIIEDQKITCITGKSGAGKSTLINLICGLHKPAKGEIVTDGKGFSVVFQDDRLLPWYTAEKNISIVSDKNSAAKWLKAVGLDGSQELLPSQMSGGMKRRLALARALAFDAGTLILDEPLNGVDSETKSILLDIIKEQSRTKSVILISHNSNEIEKLADNIVTI